ncbi:hypothetical protein Patl1_00167 [Pistacia atlantica]|uniref:Uncharacterized protein n=1 Tax=Pistacia atlantica TaxID=434234 RepID=A0ACC1CC41_9ROSI|nr:hypothetical protein Patl1_00167 [Pistacia atlantica]
MYPIIHLTQRSNQPAFIINQDLVSLLLVSWNLKLCLRKWRPDVVSLIFIRLKHCMQQKTTCFFQGNHDWARHVPMKLTYAFSKEYLINYLKISDIKVVFKRAFGKWASVIPVSFIETDDYGFADIRIGFYSGDHGDGEPFDGVLGVLAHSFSPESGKFHLDAAETWAIDFEMEKSPVAVDLESVAIHEIGHLLGLAHSPNKEAVMYATLKPRDKKVDLALDDIQGVQALYGSNPNFTFGSLLESDISTNPAVNLRIRWFMWATLILLWFLMIM